MVSGQRRAYSKTCAKCGNKKTFVVVAKHKSTKVTENITTMMVQRNILTYGCSIHALDVTEQDKLGQGLFRTTSADKNK